MKPAESALTNASLDGDRPRPRTLTRNFATDVPEQGGVSVVKPGFTFSVQTCGTDNIYDVSRFAPLRPSCWMAGPEFC